MLANVRLSKINVHRDFVPLVLALVNQQSVSRVLKSPLPYLLPHLLLHLLPQNPLCHVVHVVGVLPVGSPDLDQRPVILKQSLCVVVVQSSRSVDQMVRGNVHLVVVTLHLYHHQSLRVLSHRVFNVPALLLVILPPHLFLLSPPLLVLLNHVQSGTPSVHP